VNQQIDADVGALQIGTDRAQRELFLESTLLVPLVLIVVLIFALRLSRPLRQIDRAIGELGRGNFSHEIAVRGPVDLERLGHQLTEFRRDLAQRRIAIAAAPDVAYRQLSGLPPAIRLAPGKLEITCTGAQDLLCQIMELGQAIGNDYEKFEAVVASH